MHKIYLHVHQSKNKMKFHNKRLKTAEEEEEEKEEEQEIYTTELNCILTCSHSIIYQNTFHPNQGGSDKKKKNLLSFGLLFVCFLL